MRLSEAEARKIINLNPYNSIDAEIAERQFQVILKGFNYLNCEEADFLYIADEVGLGKTYIAVGIASLLRHFSSIDRRAIYKDVVLVPKHNLQYKWVKEINNFIAHNYLINCNIVKSVLGSPVGDCTEHNIHHHANSFQKDTPSYEIYRNSSFSIATTREADWKSKLEKELPDSLRPQFNKGRKLFRGEKEILLKRLFAFLLNISFPQIDLLIVDEAHNFKHGIEGDVAYRNQLVSRLMGVIQPEDESIFSEFPELRHQVTKKANKIIFLSATPIDNGLFELKQQFDCFLPNHKFKNSESINDDVKNSLNTFMIRGLMKIKLKHEGVVSRNMYRHEHRRGNVVKLEDAQPQYVEDDLESIIIGLLQYKTLKHFNESNNKSFEIGMLAGFETFNAQNETEKEYENSSDSNNKSLDQNIIKNIADSYFETFNSHLPHPKQDNLIKVLFDGVKSGNKSLIFVRRIASVIELERKLTFEIEDWVYGKTKKYIKSIPRLNQLKKAFDERHQILEIEKVILDLGKKLFEGSKRVLIEIFDCKEHDLAERINEELVLIYSSEEDHEDLIRFRELIKNHIRLKNIKSSLKELSVQLISKNIELKNHEFDAEDEEEQFSDLNENVFGYFFSSYFSSKRYPEGFNFRKRAATKDWYMYNVYHLIKIIPELSFNSLKLKEISFSEKDKTDARRMYAINERLLESITITQNQDRHDDNEIDGHFTKRTFLNYLLEGVLEKEFRSWVKNKWETPSKGYSFWDDLAALNDMFQGVFRNGSGLLPAYIAECVDKDSFENSLMKILQESFPETIKELCQIIIDFDKIITTNFSNRSRIQRALYGQYPIAGVSGHHKRDVNRMATQFRMPGYPYVLITTDILKEGEDLHLYCKDVYHYGVAWNPSDMEQRTGRIDRINSHCYFELKDDGSRNFDNALQVFYPYLADTLEVNQVAKVFNKMNDFIQTFYDISVIREKDSKASTDTIVKKIPTQIKELLTSKYDYKNFKEPNTIDNDFVAINEDIGYSKASLEEVLENVFKMLKESFCNYFVAPKMNKEIFSITANLNLEGRRAPLIISLVKGENFDEVLIAIKSIICRSSELRRRLVREEIRTTLANQSLQLIENNDFLLVQKKIELDSSLNHQFDTINKVALVADKLEEEYTGGDLVS